MFFFGLCIEEHDRREKKIMVYENKACSWVYFYFFFGSNHLPICMLDIKSRKKIGSEKFSPALYTSFDRSRKKKQKYRFGTQNTKVEQLFTTKDKLLFGHLTNLRPEKDAWTRMKISTISEYKYTNLSVILKCCGFPLFFSEDGDFIVIPTKETNDAEKK